MLNRIQCIPCICFKTWFKSRKTNYSFNDTFIEFDQYEKHDKAPFIIYGDLERLIKHVSGCENNPENSCTMKVGGYISSGFWVSIILSFKSIENKHNVYRGEDCMKKFCHYLGKHAIEIEFNNKKVKLLTNVIIQVNIEVLLIAYLTESIVFVKKLFYNIFNYNYHFSIKESAEEFEKKFICLRKSIENI